MWTPSRGPGSGRRAGLRRIADYIGDDHTDASDNESFITSHSDELLSSTSAAAGAGGSVGMLPAFLADQSDLVEVMLELDEESMVVRSVTPTAGPAAPAGAGTHTPGSGRNLSRSSSTSSKIRRTFAWLRSPAASAPEQPREAAMASRERRRVQARLDRSLSGARRALKGLRFISRATGSAEATALWGAVEERFDALSRDGLLARDDFGDCIGTPCSVHACHFGSTRFTARSRAGIGDELFDGRFAGMVDSKEFAVGIFDALARRRRQTLQRVTKEELHDFWLQISDQSFDARLQIFFDMVDTNVDGRITREEVQELIVLSASANKLSRLKEQAEEYALLIMEELDPEGLGYIELWQLEALLLQRDAYMSYSRPLSSGSGSAAQWSQDIGAQEKPATAAAPGRGGWRWSPRRAAGRARVAAEENWRRAWVLALWVAAMAALFAWRFAQYRRSVAFEGMGHCLPTAKGAAETLKLNMALVLLPVCRITLTRLRSSWARFVVPLDDCIAFHKVVAMAIAAGICLHAGNHLACDFPRLIASSPAEYRPLTGFFGEEKPTYRSLLSGVVGVTGVVMVALMAVSFTLAARPLRRASTRRTRLPSPLGHLAGFNAFWYSHHLLVVVYLLLLVHGWFMFLVSKWYQRTTWMYIAVPFALHVGERTLRALRSKAYAAKILKCPTISPFEWHPFSITSAPGDDYISVHIQTRGDWTQELKHIFVENYMSPCLPGRASFGDLGMAEQKSPPRLLVDGPYGAPAQDFRNYDVLLLVGLGIGATPFISILRDLLNNIKLADELMDLSMETSRSEDSSNTTFSVSTASSNKRRAYRTSRAHFYWVTREPGSFEWFKSVMDEVAEMDKKGVIELHNYLTSVYEERDARTTLLSMVQALNHAKNGIDIVSGTRVRTHFARPNWKEEFTRISAKHPGSTVGVFYCGKPTLAKELKKLSLEMSHKTTTRFHFHKEYF
uniref:Membrane-bound NADPH oxidase n=1 Tax=Hordeum vulgare subsp. vulgare TaxID=112509 RepID=A0A287TXD0_HORVV|nr:membrane-bound NADPH oxidase [Hordeum vulgare subsp. vulgare]